MSNNAHGHTKGTGMKIFLSLGAGVQSSTMALMAAKGEIEMPDAAIFADTHAEPKAVYDYLNWLETQLPFPVFRVSKGNLGEDQLNHKITAGGKKYIKNLIPAFFRKSDGGVGMMPRYCTSDYKITPVRQKVRELSQGKSCEVWIGISTDEAIRQKPSNVKYITHVFPLLDNNMSRGHCLEWMEKNNYPMPPKSSCIFCPYHSDEQWAALSENELQEVASFEQRWNEALKTDSRINQITGVVRLHRSLDTIDKAYFYDKERKSQLDMFGNECEGMCGV